MAATSTAPLRGIHVPYIDVLQQSRGTGEIHTGLLLRNAKLAADNHDQISKLAMKTGTTICGVVCKDGVVMAADTRASIGTFVSVPNLQKLHCLAPNLWCAGAGVAGDLIHVSRALRYDLKLFSMQTKRMVRVQTAVKRAADEAFRYQGIKMVYFIMAGVDPTGAYLYSIDADGCSQSAAILALGSGGYFAHAVLESNYRDGLTVDEGAELAADAIEAGILNDLGSGSVVDVIKIRMEQPENSELVRSFRKVIPPVTEVPGRQLFPRGTTKVLKETIVPTGTAAATENITMTD